MIEEFLVNPKNDFGNILKEAKKKNPHLLQEKKDEENKSLSNASNQAVSTTTTTTSSSTSPSSSSTPSLVQALGGRSQSTSINFSSKPDSACKLLVIIDKEVKKSPLIKKYFDMMRISYVEVNNKEVEGKLFNIEDSYKFDFEIKGITEQHLKVTNSQIYNQHDVFLKVLDFTLPNDLDQINNLNYLVSSLRKKHVLVAGIDFNSIKDKPEVQLLISKINQLAATQGVELEFVNVEPNQEADLLQVIAPKIKSKDLKILSGAVPKSTVSQSAANSLSSSANSNLHRSNNTTSTFSDPLGANTIPHPLDTSSNTNTKKIKVPADVPPPKSAFVKSTPPANQNSSSSAGPSYWQRPSNRFINSHNFTFVMLGDSGSGKSQLINRYINDSFDSAYQTTRPSKFSNCDKLINERPVKITIWENTTHQRILENKDFIRKADVCILTIDITNENALTNAQSELNGISNEKVILVVNKADSGSKDAKITSQQI